jgi:hypothetical protein
MRPVSRNGSYGRTTGLKAGPDARLVSLPWLMAGVPSRAQGTIIAVNEIEEGTGLGLDFGKLASVAAGGAHVVPTVLQDADSGEFLFIG